MSKTINFEYKGINYTLEYNRDVIKLLEKNGFDINEFLNKPMLSISMAFEGAFYMHHRKTNTALIHEIYDNMGDKEQLTKALYEMINETYSELFDEDEDKDNTKKIQWKSV